MLNINILNRIGFSLSDLRLEHFEFTKREIELKLRDNLYYYIHNKDTNTASYFFNADDISSEELTEILKKYGIKIVQI